MPFLTSVLISMAAFSGLLLGALLGLAAKEELPAGKPWFLLMQPIILVVIMVMLLNYLQVTMLSRILIYLALLIILSVNLRSWVIYSLLPLPLWLTLQNAALSAAMACLILLYGFPTGSLAVARSKEHWPVLMARLTLGHLHFVIISVALAYFF